MVVRDCSTHTDVSAQHHCFPPKGFHNSFFQRAAACLPFQEAAHNINYLQPINSVYDIEQMHAFPHLKFVANRADLPHVLKSLSFPGTLIRIQKYLFQVRHRS
eukprot:1824163-Amphidinium_carterae.1